MFLILLLGVVIRSDLRGLFKWSVAFSVGTELLETSL